MNKLIKEAEELCKQIDKAQVHLINARLSNDEEGKKSAISEMETAMCNAMQLLKCFIERKDNIVDLSKVWHWYKDEKPRNLTDLCIFTLDGIPIADIHNLKCFQIYVLRYIENRHTEHLIRWAYLNDLLPKGGN